MSLLKLNILDLQGSVFTAEVDMVVLPGIYGDMSISGVGRDFVHLLTTGIVYVYQGSNVSKRFLVLSGTVLAIAQEITISVDKTCLDLDKVDAKYFEESIKKYENLLADAEHEHDKSFFQKEIALLYKAQSLIDSHYYK